MTSSPRASAFRWLSRLFCQPFSEGNHVRFGSWAERLAARHLSRHGYEIIARNYKVAGAEIDLIALHGQTLVFVEVKARATGRFGSGEEAVDKRKRKQIRRAALAFLRHHNLEDKQTRFDVVTLTGFGFRPRFEIIKNAF